jgi:hypothetical protein
MAAGHRAFGAARSVLDSCEHDGILAASGPPMPPKPQLAAVYPRFLTAANNAGLDDHARVEARMKGRWRFTHGLFGSR